MKKIRIDTSDEYEDEHLTVIPPMTVEEALESHGYDPNATDYIEL